MLHKAFVLVSAYGKGLLMLLVAFRFLMGLSISGGWWVRGLLVLSGVWGFWGLGPGVLGCERCRCHGVSYFY